MVVGSTDKNLYALNAGSGDLVWSYNAAQVRENETYTAHKRALHHP